MSRKAPTPGSRPVVHPSLPKAFIDYLAPDQPVVNFCDLYVNALYNSPKCSKVLKDKMVETPAFAIEFAKIALLTNVGRINTTMACE